MNASRDQKNGDGFFKREPRLSHVSVCTVFTLTWKEGPLQELRDVGVLPVSGSGNPTGRKSKRTKSDRSSQCMAVGVPRRCQFNRGGGILYEGCGTGTTLRLGKIEVSRQSIGECYYGSWCVCVHETTTCCVVVVLGSDGNFRISAQT